MAAHSVAKGPCAQKDRTQGFPAMANRLLFRRCKCQSPSLERIPRSWWMRLFKSRRLYVCNVCKARVFAIREEVETAHWHKTTLIKTYLPTSSYEPR
jgi:hypothetical protein